MQSRPDSQLFIGLMSGTSLDSIDAALVDFSTGSAQLLSSYEHPIPAALQQELTALCLPGDNEIERMGVADKTLGRAFAMAVKQLLQATNISPSEIAAIGSHGQTIRHLPDIDNAFTLQIGDPNTIAFETGITTVADFRRKDMAAGGQGAPLAPAFHAAFFSTEDNSPRAVINIGGISNVTLLHPAGDITGYDIGPGNILMDLWTQQHKQQAYDRDGEWAASGKVIESVLQAMLREPYFAQQAPKSTGRELFNRQWLDRYLADADYEPKDIQATLLELTAKSIAEELNQHHCKDIYISGGGAYNKALMRRLQVLLAPYSVSSTDSLGIAPQWVEACGFAWLARQTLNRQSGNQIAVTGASQPVVLGAIYYPE